jgi:hypothetical protein
MPHSLAIQPRFRGPPESGNGGYSCGLLAAHVPGPAEVTLRRPPPIGRSLAVEVSGDGVATLRDGDEVVAEARPASALEVEVPAPVSVEDARTASAAYPGASEHPFPSCFGCGTEREPGDGLRIFPGPIAGRDGLFAAPWTPDPSVAGELGHVRDEVVWAALDCSSGWCFVGHPELSPDAEALLGRMQAAIEGAVLAGEPHVVMAWPLAVEGRKRASAAAIVDEGGRVLARARALWIELQ